MTLKYILSTGTIAQCIRIIALSALVLLPIHSVGAGVTACRLADGSVTYQDSACEVIPKAKPTKSAEKQGIPFGIESSWFDAPPIVPDRAICTKADCLCGMYDRKFKSGLPQAVADALYIDGSWHRFDSISLQLEINKTTLSSIDRSDMIKGRDEAACNIIMSQKILRLFGSEVMLELKNKKIYAEDRGLDDVEQCIAGDTLVCSYTDSIQLYDRMQSDIKALRNQSRTELDIQVTSSE